MENKTDLKLSATVCGRYIKLVHGVYKPNNITFGDYTLLLHDLHGIVTSLHEIELDTRQYIYE